MIVVSLLKNIIAAAILLQQSPAPVPSPVPSSSELAGTFAWQSGGFQSPVACAITPNGLVAVADASGQLVGLSADDGSEIWRISTAGSQMSGVEKLVQPSGVAALADGSILLSDLRRGSIDHYSPLGVWQEKFATDAPLRSPGQIAVGMAGNPPSPCVAIVDEATGEIVICSLAGKEIRRISRAILQIKNSAPGFPYGVAFCGDGKLAVSASEQNQIFVLDLSDHSSPVKVLASWGGRGPFPGLFHNPMGVASDGRWIFTADQFNHRVSRQDLQGRGQIAYGQHAVRPREGEGAVHYPTAIAVCNDVNRGATKTPLAVVCEPFERRVQAFVTGLAVEPADIRLVLPKLEGIQSHFGASSALDGQRLFLHDPESCSIVVFDLSRGQPLHVTNIASAGVKPHEIGEVDALLALNNGTRLLVADGINRRLALWELTPPPKEIIFERFMAKLVKTRSYDRLNLPADARITGLARAHDGSILALCNDGPCIVTLDSSLRTATTAPIAAPDTTARAQSIAVAADGTVGVVFDRPAMLCQFKWEQIAWRTAGCQLLGDVSFASGLIAAPNNEWVVVDSWGDSVARFASDGSVRRIGSRGVADGQLWLPGAAEIAANGDLYVIDGGNHRAQRFGADGEWQMTFSLGRSYTRARTADEVLKIRKKTDAPTDAKPTGAAP